MPVYREFQEKEVIFQKRVPGFNQVSKRAKHLRPRGFNVFERLET